MRLAVACLLVWGCGSKEASPELARAEPQADHQLHRNDTADGVTIAGKGVPLATQPMLDWIGLPMSGDVDVAIDVRTPGGDLRKASGSIAITCAAGCRLGDDKVKLKPSTKNARNSAFVGDGIEFGHIDFDHVDVAIAIVDGKATITKWEVASKDVAFEVTGTIELGKTMADSRIEACLRFKSTAALAARAPATEAVLATTGAPRAADGMFNIRLTGSLTELKRLGLVCDGSAPPPEPAVLAPDAGSGAASPSSTNDVDAATAALIAKAIVKKTDTSYEVRHTEFEQLLAQPTAMTKGARVVPTMKDGKPIGFKLYAIRPESIYAHLGLQNGDLLLTIGGGALTTADQALETYTRLRGATPGTSVIVTLERRGSELTITYTLR